MNWSELLFVIWVFCLRNYHTVFLISLVWFFFNLAIRQALTFTLCTYCDRLVFEDESLRVHFEIVVCPFTFFHLSSEGVWHIALTIHLFFFINKDFIVVMDLKFSWSLMLIMSLELCTMDAPSPCTLRRLLSDRNLRLSLITHNFFHHLISRLFLPLYKH